MQEPPIFILLEPELKMLAPDAFTTPNDVEVLIKFSIAISLRKIAVALENKKEDPPNANPRSPDKK